MITEAVNPQTGRHGETPGYVFDEPKWLGTGVRMAQRSMEEEGLVGEVACCEGSQYDKIVNLAVAGLAFDCKRPGKAAFPVKNAS